MDNKNRVGLLDEVRGFAIICMVVYHTMVDLKMLGVDVPIFFEDWFYVIQRIFAGAFIFISGIVCNYSRNNIKRGAECFFIGMIFTFVTAYVTPSAPDLFGILHCLGICMMLYGIAQGIFERIPSIIGFPVCVMLFMLTFNFQKGYTGIEDLFKTKVPDLLYSTSCLFPLGFPGKGFVSSDYFPLFPWLFLFIAGAFFGVWVKDGLMPKFFYKTRIKFLAAAGRHSLLIYVLHQPIIYPIVCLILGKSVF